jgi:ABC-type branched-subunit amino acid transport system substrate-binding protein
VNGKQLPVYLWAITVHCLLLTACTVTRPVVKIGLVAPFEGRYREVGYEVIYAVRLAVREANAAGGVAGYSVELFALDDGGDPAMAVEQARKLAADPQVVGVIGHWRGETTERAASVYESEGIPLLATGLVGELPASVFRISIPASACPGLCFESLEDIRLREYGKVYVTAPAFNVPAPLPVDVSDPTFADRYRAISNGTEPRFNAVLAYDAARLLLDAIARDIQANTTPTRAGVAAALAQSDFDGLSGPIRFTADRERERVGSWEYQWDSFDIR